MTRSTLRPDEPEDKPDVLVQDAHAWLTRLTSGKATQWEAQAFRRWRDANPRHQRAFEEARVQWQHLKPAIGDLLATHAETAEQHRRALQKPRMSRRAWMGVAAGAAAAAGVAAVRPPLGLWPAADEWNADYRTATGERRAVVLAERVSVTMNTRTSIRRIAQQGETVGMDLLAGEAAIRLSDAAGRPFGVVAGAGRSSSESGLFEVRHLDAKVCVTCIEGAVRVAHPSGMRVLQARQQTVYDARSVGAVVGLDEADMPGWLQGELVFRRAPLAAVVEEINRYRAGRVVLVATALRDKTLSARFQLTSLDTALLQIERSFGLSARSLPGGVLLLS